MPTWPDAIFLNDGAGLLFSHGIVQSGEWIDVESGCLFIFEFVSDWQAFCNQLQNIQQVPAAMPMKTADPFALPLAG
jgi:hypothetical protein